MLLAGCVVILAHPSAQRHAATRVQQRDRRLEHFAAGILEIDVNAVGHARLGLTDGCVEYDLPVPCNEELSSVMQARFPLLFGSLMVASKPSRPTPDSSGLAITPPFMNRSSP